VARPAQTSVNIVVVAKFVMRNRKAIGFCVFAGVLGVLAFLVQRQPARVARVAFQPKPVVGENFDPGHLSKTIRLAIRDSVQKDDPGILVPLFGGAERARTPAGLTRFREDLAHISTGTEKFPVRIMPGRAGEDPWILEIRGYGIVQAPQSRNGMQNFIHAVVSRFNEGSSFKALQGDPAVTQELRKVAFGVDKAELESQLLKQARSAGVPVDQLAILAGAGEDRDPGAAANAILGSIAAVKGDKAKWIALWGPKIAELRLAANALNSSQAAISEIPYGRLPELEVLGDVVVEQEFARDIALVIVVLMVAVSAGLVIGGVLEVFRAAGAGAGRAESVQEARS